MRNFGKIALSSRLATITAITIAISVSAILVTEATICKKKKKASLEKAHSELIINAKIPMELQRSKICSARIFSPAFFK